jgi:hypothetical protein
MPRVPRPPLVVLGVVLALAAIPAEALSAATGAAESAPPSVRLVDPEPGLVSVSGTIDLDARASDDVRVVRVDYFVDGALVAFDDSCCDWEEQWDTTSVADGAHVVVATARDSDGNVATSTPVSVSVNNAPDTSPPPSPTGGDPLTCEGYPEQRVFLEAQGWWTRTPTRTGTDFGHVHVGTCFPWAQRLTGTVHLDVRVMLHENPGVLRQVRIQIFKAAPDTFSEQQLTCPQETCTWWFRMAVDTSKATKDGCQEFRIQAHVDEPDGNRTLATNGWRAFLANGKLLDPYCDFRGFDFVEGRGWYGDFGGEEFGYENGRLEDPLPVAPVFGTWAPHVKMGPGAGGIPTTYHSVHVDPDFHHGDRGIVLEEGPGKFDDELPIDTRLLGDGAHRLVLRTDADTNTGSTLSGLLVIPFTVANGSPPPPPPPPPPNPRGCTVFGTPANDLIGGTNGDDVICGFGGKDEIRGYGGNDVVHGDGGNDLVIGGTGNDRLLGGAGGDRLRGDSGNDVLSGGGGGDVHSGGDGRDTLYARDRRRDRVSGGPGRDRAKVDRRLDRRRSVEALF